MDTLDTQRAESSHVGGGYSVNGTVPTITGSTKIDTSERQSMRRSGVMHSFNNLPKEVTYSFIDQALSLAQTFGQKLSISPIQSKLNMFQIAMERVLRFHIAFNTASCGAVMYVYGTAAKGVNFARVFDMIEYTTGARWLNHGQTIKSMGGQCFSTLEVVNYMAQYLLETQSLLQARGQSGWEFWLRIGGRFLC
jgi:hypothetical protein